MSVNLLATGGMNLPMGGRSVQAYAYKIIKHHLMGISGASVRPTV
jgi:hypothetical protein